MIIRSLPAQLVIYNISHDDHKIPDSDFKVNRLEVCFL